MWRSAFAPPARARAARRSRVPRSRGLEVDVELDAGEGLAAEVVEALFERQRRAPGRVLEVVGEHEPAGLAVVARSGRTSNSTMSQPWASAASKLAVVLPGAMWSAPLWPMRRTARVGRGQLWHPGHQYVVRLSSPWPRARDAPAAARAGAAGAVVDLAVAASGCRRAPTPACAGAVARTIAQRLVVADRRRPGATGRPRPASSPRPSRGCRCRRSCAGRAARRRSGASGRPRAAAAGRAPRRSSSARRCRGRARARRRSKRRRVSVSSSSTGPSNCTTSWPSRAMTSHARRGARCQRAPLGVDAPRAGHAQVRVDRQVAVEAQEAGACRGRRPTRPRGPARRSRPAVVAEARVRRGDRVGDAGPRAPAGSGWRRSGWCRPRASLFEGTVRAVRRRSRPLVGAEHVAGDDVALADASGAVAARVAGAGRAGRAPRRSPRSSRGATSTTSRSSRSAGAAATAAGSCRSASAERSSIALDRLDRVRSLDPLRWRMEAEAGVTTATVAAPRARERPALPAGPGRGRAVAARRQPRDQRGRAACLQVRRDGALGDRASRR